MKFNTRFLGTFAVICLLTLFMGCSGGGGSSTGTTATTGTTGTIGTTGTTAGSGGTGTLALSLTDAPSVDFQAVYVTIERVEVHLGGNEASQNNWQAITPPEFGVTGFVKKTYNLLELTNGILEELGMTELPAGFYTQMRLYIGTEPDKGLNISEDPHEHANYVIERGSTAQIPLKVPSGTQTGIKLVRGFTVGENQLTELILDFDAAKSVHRAGNSGKYILKPTIKVLGTEVLGYFIEGTVFDDQDNRLGGALVSAQVSDPSASDAKNKVVVESTSSTDVNGDFRLLVQPGTYNIVAYKDTYGFDIRCGVNAEIDAVSGVTTELILPNLGNGATEYGYVGGDVTVVGGGDATISFRAPAPLECTPGSIELKSITINVVQDPALYQEILPVSAEPYYEVVASSEGKTSIEKSGVTVESGVTTVVDFVLVE